MVQIGSKRARESSWAGTRSSPQFLVIWEVYFDESFFDVSSVFKCYVTRIPYLRLSGTFSTHFVTHPSKNSSFSIPVKRHPLGTWFNIPLKFLTCIRCLLLTYLLIFFFVFLYLTCLKACQVLSRIVTAFTSK